jgi:hypothetical protein
MASANFVTRFKGKTSSITKLGTFNTDLSKPVNKQSREQSVLRTTLLDPEASFTRPIRALRHLDTLATEAKTSALQTDSSIGKLHSRTQADLSKSPELSRQATCFVPLARFGEGGKAKTSVSGTSFCPYTLKDYRNIRHKKYYSLGGLGANLGTEQWAIKKFMYNRRARFAREIQQVHAEAYPPLPKIASEQASPEPSARLRALEFARQVKRPPMKLRVGRRTGKVPSFEAEGRSQSFTRLK